MMPFASKACSVLAIVYMPLAKAASITMMAPLLVMPLAWMVLGARSPVRRPASWRRSSTCSSSIAFSVTSPTGRLHAGGVQTRKKMPPT